MKRIYILLFVVFCCLQSRSQNKKSITCMYKILVQDFTLEELNKITGDQNIRTNIISRLEESKKRVLHLNGNQESAFFYEAEKMKNDASTLKYQIAPLDNYYYRDGGKVVVMNTFINEEFYVSLPATKYNWVVTGDTKFIDGYKCYKATGVHKINDFRGNKEYNVIAWFCPNLPYHYGPAEFFGLPGLIFEAHYENAKEKYVIQSIKFIDDLEVPILKNKNIISEAEFTSKFNMMMENMGN